MSRLLRAALVAAAAALLAVSSGAGPAYADGHGGGGGQVGAPGGQGGDQVGAPGGGGQGGGTGGGGPKATSVGYDISYPQCNTQFPKNAAFGIVGVNGGRVHLANPCLGTDDGPSELAWAIATGKPQFYANTGNPGPDYSSYWDVSGWNGYPQACSADDPNSAGCSYDYGWYAAQDSFTTATNAEFQLNPGADAIAAAAAVPWWLDVETGNSWQSLEPLYAADLATAYANDTAALQGEVAYLQSRGVAQIGFYSTGYQWGQITGGALFLASPTWVAGFSNETSAAAGCASLTGFSGGPVTLTQYQTRGYDADHSC